MKALIFVLSSLLLISACGNSSKLTKLESSKSIHDLSASMSETKHVLDPLTPDEIQGVVEHLKTLKLLGEGWYLQALYTAEPKKNSDGVYPAADESPRQAYAVVLNPRKNERYECVMDVKTGELLSKKAIEGQPPVLDMEYDLAEKAIKANFTWQQAMKERGFDKFEDIFVDTWAPGDLSKEKVDTSHRLLRAMFYLRENSWNPYARPIEGLTAIYDVTDDKVVQLLDIGKKPLSKNPQDYSVKAQKESPMPESCSTQTAPFQMNGTQVSWKNWRFRYQMHPREGLVLYEIGYFNQGRVRSILDRASLSEMMVPYSDPSPGWHWRSAFDQGEYGLGNSANPLQRGVHYPENGYVFDAWMAGNNGELVHKPNSIAIYERFGGMLWSHMDSDTSVVKARSGKELVVTFLFTVGNYDYGINWIFRENGSIRTEGVLTGSLLTKGHQMKRCGRCGTLSRADQFGMLIDDNLIATAHQHFFNFRLDFAIDGSKNRVAEVSLEEADDSIKDPFGNVFLINEQLLNTEQEGMRDTDAHRAKHWWIFNHAKKNRLGHFPGYVLEPGESGGYFGKKSGFVSRMAPFIGHQLYVTRYRPEEMHAAGDFPSQAPKAEGLKYWIQSRDDSIVDQDLVVWYTLGVTHLPVVEDWAVMPVHKTGFTLKPMNFFEEAQGLE